MEIDKREKETRSMKGGDKVLPKDFRNTVIEKVIGNVQNVNMIIMVQDRNVISAKLLKNKFD